MTINFDSSVFNDNFLPLLNDDSRYLCLMGGAGSGKSYFAAYKILFRMLNETDNRFLFVRATKDSIRNSMYKLFKDLVIKHNLSDFFDFRDTDMTIKCPITNSEIICVGLSDVERIKSIADPTGAWIEEASEIDEKDHIQLNLRIRGEGGAYRQTILTFNPVDEQHWIRVSYFPVKFDDALYTKNIVRYLKEVKLQNGKTSVIKITLHRSTAYDNKFINAEYLADLETIKSRDYNYWNIYANAHWGSLGNLVFNPSWEIKERFPSSFDEVIYGLDFGFIHPMALVEVGIKNEEFYVREKFYSKGYTVNELIKYIYDNALIEPDAVIYADPSSPAYIKQMEDAGFNIKPALRGNDSIMAGIDLLKSVKIYSHKNNVNLNRELKMYKYEEDKYGNPIEGKVIKINDDCISAVRYAIYTYNKVGEIYVGFIE